MRAAVRSRSSFEHYHYGWRECRVLVKFKMIVNSKHTVNSPGRCRKLLFHDFSKDSLLLFNACFCPWICPTAKSVAGPEPWPSSMVAQFGKGCRARTLGHTSCRFRLTFQESVNTIVTYKYMVYYYTVCMLQRLIAIKRRIKESSLSRQWAEQVL